MADSTTVFAAKDESFSATVNRLQKSLGSFEGNLSTFNERAANMGKTFAGLAVKLAALGVAFLGVRGAVRSMGAAIELGGQLNDLSARTGETAGNLLILRRAFENAGAGAESVGITINRLQRNIVEGASGAKAQAEAFDKLGLSAAKLKDMAPTEQLQAVARALRDLENDSDRTNLAMLLLGRSGGELIPLFRAMDIELDRANKQVGRAAELMNVLNPDLDRISDNFKTISDKSTDFALGLISSLVPALADVTERLSMIDAAAVGEKFSIYLKRTVDWAAATLGLAGALKNVEVAIKAIAAGNFGDGLKLIFLTARDTALNAINNIVAAAGAALSALGEAMRALFNKDSTTFAYIRGGVMWLSAFITEQISGGLAKAVEAFGKAIPEMMRPIADKMANSFLPGISAMGKALQGIIDNVDVSPMSASLRKAQKKAEEASADYFNLFYREAGKLKVEWTQVGKAMPEAFAKSYEENMKSPLFNMTEKTKETAEQMEKVAAATRAAAFDAEKFGQALRDAQVAGFAGPAPDSPFPANTRGGGTATPTTTPQPEPAPSNGSAPRASGNSTPRTPDAPLTRNQRVAQMRAGAAFDRATRRVGELEAAGQFGAAVSAQMRGERARDRVLERSKQQDFAEKMYGTRELGEATRKMREDLTAMVGLEGVRGMSDQDIKDYFREQSKSEDERKQEAASGAAGGGAAGGGGIDPLVPISSKLDKIISEIIERLPQNSLTYA
jgi:hypothetical protein